MRYFVGVQTIVIEPCLIVKAKIFAKQVTPTIGSPGNGYRDTYQSNLKKIENDHFVSKVGEEAVRIVFEQCSRQVRGPDYQIYDGKQKSWDSDLYIDGFALAVKNTGDFISKKVWIVLDFPVRNLSQRSNPVQSECLGMFCRIQ